MIAKFGVHNLETSFYGMMQSMFLYFDQFRCGLWMWQTERWTVGQMDGCTYILIANAAIYYVTQPTNDILQLSRLYLSRAILIETSNTPLKCFIEMSSNSSCCCCCYYRRRHHHHHFRDAHEK